MTRIATIKCTGEKVQVKQLKTRVGYWIELFEDKNGFEKYGRTFHYTDLTFEKGYLTSKSTNL